MMLTLSGYSITTQLYNGIHSLVYRGRRTADNLPVVLKILREEHPTPKELARFRREYEITSGLNIDGVIEAYGLEPYRSTLMMILEDVGGDSLARLLPEAPLDVATFLRLATRIADILGRIHQQRIIHKHITPSHIVWNPETDHVKIIDFGIASMRDHTILSPEAPEQREGTLAYISPEQTGRMNRIVDYRADLYSLGATFYEMLTGQLPFTAEDAVGMVHCHIARQPVPPHEILPNIPSVLSEIVLKLLAKNAEDRYQSAYGLKADLEWCLQHLPDLHELSDFQAGQQDFSDQFSIPSKLYGREQELHTLMQAFERICNGHREFLLIAGYAGVGKSALVNEIRSPVVAKGGYFISGKFDQFKRNIPYSGIIQAFQELFRQLLTESDKRIVVWKEQLLKALGPNGQIMTEVIPEVELIIGPQPPVLELPPAQAQNRFNFVFRNFMRIFATAEHPFVLFLDDLQWIDSPSLKLIELFMVDSGMQHMLIVGAYRDNEVHNTHPLMSMLHAIHGTGTTVNTIPLNPLTLEPVNQLIADTLKHTLEQSRLLAELSLQKTAGNPFFLTQFLRTLYEDELLECDVTRGVWKWELDTIRNAEITANVVELMADRIQKLPEETQHVVKLAACIGNLFDLQTLSIVNEQSKADVAGNLWRAVEEGLIISIDDTYTYVDMSDDGNDEPPNCHFKFLHDRVQQAAYSLIEDVHKQDLHLKIGRLLISSMSETEQEEMLFEIVNHLNIGKPHIMTSTEKEKLAEFNLKAGKKAKASAAYQEAFTYLQRGIELLEEAYPGQSKRESWQRHYEITLALHVELAEAAYLHGNIEQMERLTHIVLQYAKTMLDKVKVYEVRIESYMAQNKAPEAVKMALHVLELLGITLPEKPTRLHTLLGLMQIRMALVGKRIEMLNDLPEMTDSYTLAAMRILSRVTLAAYFTVLELFPLIVFKQVILSLKYGNTAGSASAYAWYGFILCRTTSDFVIKRDPELGYRFSKLAVALMERRDAKEDKAKTLFIVNCGITHWKEHCKEELQPLLEGYHSGLETGDFSIAAAAQSLYAQYSCFIGEELTGLEQGIRQLREGLRHMKHERYLLINALHLQFVLNLMGQTADSTASPPYRIIGQEYDEEIALPLHQHAKDSSAICLVYFYKLILAYLFQEYSEAVNYAVIAEDTTVGAVLTTPLANFYGSLARLAAFDTVPEIEQKRFLRKVAASQKKIKTWAYHAPMNYLHKYYLIEAERMRVSGNDYKAMEYYDQAIALAREHHYPNEEALANERAAKFYLTRQQEKIAQTYLKESRACYCTWGAMAKVQHLDQTYPQLLITPQNSLEAARALIKTTPSLDLLTLMKASQTMAGEIVLEKLLAKMVHIAMENAGAQKVCLILQRNNQWFLEAEGVADKTPVKVLQSISIENAPTPVISEAIVNYVIRTKEDVVVNDAIQEGRFTHDHYITKHHPQSVLCLPLINQGRVIGILYLENNLVTGAFTPDHLEVLNLLSSQMAIALENAQLYANLEDKVQERTQELEAEKEKLRESESRAQALKEDAEEARRTAEQANQAKSDFLSQMSHELRTPLTAILGYAQLLELDSNLIDKQRGAVATIHRSGEHLLSLINELLDLAKIEARKIELIPSPVYLSTFLKSLVEMTRIHAQQQDITCTAEMSSDLPVVLVDEQRLRQILLNLLNNAMKFTEEGHVRLRVYELDEFNELDGSDHSEPYKRLNSPTHKTFRFEVEDTGVGIPASHLRSIFLPFHQTGDARSRKKGTGLGLAISQQLVRVMGSELHVKSTVGQGTTFWFDLALPEATPNPAFSALLNEIRESATQAVPASLSTEFPEKPSHSNVEGDDSFAPSDFNIPPQEILVELLEFARNGRMTELRSAIAALKALDSGLTPFADRIEDLTENFQFEQIVERLKAFMPETS